MPKEKISATFQRRYFVLETIRRASRHQAWVTVQDIVRLLRGEGYEVQKHQVLRDLKALSEIFFQLECNDNQKGGVPVKGLPYGYRWVGRDRPPEAGLSIAQALSLVMVEQYLEEALPATVIESLQATFRSAHRTLELHHASRLTRWPEKIRVVTPALPLIPPKIDPKIQVTIQEALVGEFQLKVVYRAFDAESKRLLLHPLGLLQRGPTSYLVALAFGYDDILLYALHRFESARRLEEPARRPDDFDLEQYARGRGHFGSGQRLSLQARVQADMARILHETPLGQRQQLSEPDAKGWCELRVAVRDSWQLHWWLMSQADQIEVRAPTRLRKRLAVSLEDAAKLYGTAV